MKEPDISILQRDPSDSPFLFATGLECSYPVVTGKAGMNERVDELAKTLHYEHWKTDLDLCKDIGINVLRYGPAYYTVNPRADKYDWDFCDKVFNRMNKIGIIPITDLCHFGVPDFVGDFQNSDFPELFAAYAKAFAKRYEWVTLYTPVNEILITANNSAQIGFWNERLSSDKTFVTALKNCCRACLRAEEEILKVQPRAVFIESESTECYHPTEPAAIPRTDFLNERRFLALDLIYGVEVSAMMYEFLMDNGLTREEYDWFRQHGNALKRYNVMGNDYYVTNEHRVPPGDLDFQPAGRIFGYYVNTHTYFERYRMPIMHTETNQRIDMDPVQWLNEEWPQVVKLKQDGVPVIGFTWFSLIDQVDWDSTLRENNGNVNEFGLYDLKRRPHPICHAYKRLIEQWRPILPMQSVGLDVHGVSQRIKGTRKRSRRKRK